MRVMQQDFQKAMEPETIIDFISGIRPPDDKKVLVVVDDFTRPDTAVPELLLDHLFAVTNFDYSRIHILFANGMHRAMTLSEMKSRIGNTAIRNCKVYQNNPFTAHSPFFESRNDYYRIGVGCVMPHSHVTFSGGLYLDLFPR